MQTNSQIDRLGSKLKDGNIEQADLVELDAYRRQFHAAYAGVIRAVGFVNLPVTGRPSKSTGSVCDKLRRESARLSQIQDIAGCRLIVDDIPEQNSLVHRLNVLLARPRVVDRRVNPTNGYRAVHLVAILEGRFVEVQVRTTLQHLWSEISEKLADTVDPRLKYGGGDPRYLEVLRKLSGAIRSVEDEEASREKFYVAASGKSLSKPVKKNVKRLDAQLVRGKNNIISLMNDIKSI